MACFIWHQESISDEVNSVRDDRDLHYPRCYSASASPAQALSEQEWEKLFSALDSEDWEKAAGLSTQYLAKLKAEDSQKTMARLRYMLVFASAGKVTMGKMSYEEIKKVADPFVGLELQLPYAQIRQECRGNLGAICFANTGNHDVVVAYIHAFVYSKLQQKFDYAAHLEEIGTVRGIVESIEFNPNQSKLWIMRIFLKDGSIVLDK